MLARLALAGVGAVIAAELGLAAYWQWTLYRRTGVLCLAGAIVASIAAVSVAVFGGGAS